MLTNSNFLITLNQQQYYLRVLISNGDKNSIPFEVPYSIVEEISIEETLFDWNITGHIVLKNDYELIERGFIGSNRVNKSPYTFRHDGRNKVHFRCFPILTNDGSVISIKPEALELNFDFVIYNVVDLPSNDQSKKSKKLFLWDERYQHFLERNIQWSSYYIAVQEYIDKNNTTLNTSFTATNSTLNTDISALSAMPVLGDNSCKVGLAIKHLIQTACGETPYNTANNKTLKVGWPPEDENKYTNNAGINNPTLDVASFTFNWDEGSTQNKITYTSPATYNVIDDLAYLTKNYVSSLDIKEKTGLGMPGLLRLTRFSKQWELQGLDGIYAKSTSGDMAGSDTIEAIEIQTVAEDIFGSRKTPIFKGGGDSFTTKILSYRFVNMSTVDDFNLNNKPVINYDNNLCIWNIYFEENTAEAVKESIKSSFIPKIFNNNNKSGVLININKDKTNGLNTRPEHVVVQSESVKTFTRNAMIMDNIFLTQALEFNSVGATARTPGKFINIERPKGISADENDFENKFVGQWLLTAVTHIFKNDIYLNNTVGVKFNSFNELSIFKPENDSFNE